MLNFDTPEAYESTVGMDTDVVALFISESLENSPCVKAFHAAAKAYTGKAQFTIIKVEDRKEKVAAIFGLMEFCNVKLGTMP